MFSKTAWLCTSIRRARVPDTFFMRPYLSTAIVVGTCLFGVALTSPYTYCCIEYFPSTLMSVRSGAPNFVNGSTKIPESIEEYFGPLRPLEPYFSKALSHAGTLDALHSALSAGIARGKLRIGIGGGSVSVGGGCLDEIEKRWFKSLKTALERGFATRSYSVDVEIVKAAQGATGPDRLAYCLDELLPLSVDIMILEYAINEGGGKWSEVLLRQFRPAETALVFLETFSLLGGKIGKGFDSSQQFHDSLSRYYDIPLISARDAFRDEFNRHPEKERLWFADDNHHPSCFGHLSLGLLAAELMFHTIDDTASYHEPISGTANYTYLPPLYVNPESMSIFMASTKKPTCLLAAHGLAAKQSSAWAQQTGQKPTFDCTSPEDGELSIPLTCHADGRDHCQVVVSYTRSWRPMGTAGVYFNGSKIPNFIIDAFAANWVNKTQWTIQQYTGLNEKSLRIPLGDTLMRIQCNGSSTAPVDHIVDDSKFSRTAFQLHGVIYF
jgi:hypothetical protein